MDKWIVVQDKGCSLHYLLTRNSNYFVVFFQVHTQKNENSIFRKFYVVCSMYRNQRELWVFLVSSVVEIVYMEFVEVNVVEVWFYALVCIYSFACHGYFTHLLSNIPDFPASTTVTSSNFPYVIKTLLLFIGVNKRWQDIRGYLGNNIQGSHKCSDGVRINWRDCHCLYKWDVPVVQREIQEAS